MAFPDNKQAVKADRKSDACLDLGSRYSACWSSIMWAAQDIKYASGGFVQLSDPNYQPRVIPGPILLTNALEREGACEEVSDLSGSFRANPSQPSEEANHTHTRRILDNNRHRYFLRP